MMLYKSRQHFIDDMSKLFNKKFKIDQPKLNPMVAIRPMRSRPLNQLDFRECPECGALVLQGYVCGCKEDK
jgi:hypothetical protein